MEPEYTCPFVGLPIEVHTRRVPASGGGWASRLECRSQGEYCPPGDCILRPPHGTQVALPGDVKRADTGRFEIRLEGIGGLGANLIGKILADVAVGRLGFTGTNFASYGSEKKGSPVKAFVRLVEGSEIRDNTPVQNPDLLAVFHESLTKTPATFQGLRSDATVIVASKRPVEELAEEIPIPSGRLGAVDAIGIASEIGSRANIVMLGAISAALEWMEADVVEETIRSLLGSKGAKLLEKNLEAFRRGREGVRFQTIPHRGYASVPAAKPHKTTWGYENAPIGGLAPDPGGTAARDLSMMREGRIPKFIREKCTNCALCEIYCPDYAFRWEWQEVKGKRQATNIGIEYRHCKGCLRCVEVCPSEALVEVAE